MRKCNIFISKVSLRTDYCFLVILLSFVRKCSLIQAFAKFLVTFWKFSPVIEGRQNLAAG